MTTRKANQGRKARSAAAEKIPQGLPVSIADGAQRIYEAMELRKRDNGDEFYCLKDGRPEWMRDVVYAGHGDRLPNDRDYQAIRDACSALADYPEKDPDDVIYENSEPSIYTADLTRWLASSLDMVGFLDEVLEEMGGDFRDGVQLLSYAQHRYLQAVGSAVVEKLRELVPEGEDA